MVRRLCGGCLALLSLIAGSVLVVRGALIAQRLTLAEWLRLATVPVAAALLAAAAAQLTVRLGLARLG